MGTVSGRPSILPVIDHDLLACLQLSRSYPSVSVLLETAPAARLRDKDRNRLRRLLEQARHRLLAELPARQAGGLMTRLQHAALAAAPMPTSRALALFVSEDQALGVHLPVPVADRVVVDPTFATRDLARAVAHSPRYRLLTVSDRAARLYEGWPGQLSEIRSGGFPVLADGRVERHDRGLRFGKDRGRRRDARLAAHLRAVDSTLAIRRARDPLPLIVATVNGRLADSRGLPGLATDLIGTIAGNHDHTPVGRLDQLSRPVIETHCTTLQHRALDQLHDVANPQRRASGIDAVWRAAVEGRIALLCVEQGFVFPARTVHSGRRLRPATDVEHPAVLDDAVDELIELVARHAGETTIVEDDALAEHGRVSALLRNC